jgi:pilus assembly protein CpaB
VAGFVIPGTRVDVLVTIRSGQGAAQEPQTRVVLSNVQVLTAGTRYDQERATAEGKPIPTSVVTLLLVPEDAEKLTLASEEGKIMLTLRNPLDTAPTMTEGTKFSALLGKASPPPVKQTVSGRMVARPAPKPEVAAAPRIYTVETIRAAKRTEEEVR